MKTSGMGNMRRHWRSSSRYWDQNQRAARLPLPATMLPAPIPNSTGLDTSLFSDLSLCSHVCSLILNTHMNVPPQIQAGLSALEDALKSGYEDFKVTTSSFARLLHELETNKFQTNDTRLISCSESAPTRISKTWGKQRNSSPCWRTTTSRSSTRTPSTQSNHCSGSASSEQLKHGGSSSRQCLSSLVLHFCILHEPTVLSSCPYSSSHSPSVGSLAILGETCT